MGFGSNEREGHSTPTGKQPDNPTTGGKAEASMGGEYQNPSRISLNTADPPGVVLNIISERGGMDYIEGWLAVPQLPRNNEEKRRVEEVDAYALMEGLLGCSELKGTLRTIDVLNGCLHHCDTCLADAPLPSKMFSFESLERLFHDRRFTSQLQPDSLRVGSSGDILNHPEAIRIIELLLDATSDIDSRRQREKKKRHQIKVFTNYRPHLESKLDELLRLALENQDRLQVTVSLPFNRTDRVNQRFASYAQDRLKFFGDFPGDEESFSFEDWEPLYKNIDIQDVRHPRLIFMSGRILSTKANAGRVPKSLWIDRNKVTDYQTWGYAKTYMNPDALWLMVYVSPYESHTGRAFTPISPENIKAISHIPFHPDFPTPPNWRGGTGKERSVNEAIIIMQDLGNQGKPLKANTIVG